MNLLYSITLVIALSASASLQAGSDNAAKSEATGSPPCKNRFASFQTQSNLSFAERLSSLAINGDASTRDAASLLLKQTFLGMTIQNSHVSSLPRHASLENIPENPELIPPSIFADTYFKMLLNRVEDIYKNEDEHGQKEIHDIFLLLTYLISPFHEPQNPTSQQTRNASLKIKNLSENVKKFIGFLDRIRKLESNRHSEGLAPFLKSDDIEQLRMEKLLPQIAIQIPHYRSVEKILENIASPRNRINISLNDKKLMEAMQKSIPLLESLLSKYSLTNFQLHTYETSFNNNRVNHLTTVKQALLEISSRFIDYPSRNPNGVFSNKYAFAQARRPNFDDFKEKLSSPGQKVRMFAEFTQPINQASWLMAHIWAIGFYAVEIVEDFENLSLDMPSLHSVNDLVLALEKHSNLSAGIAAESKKAIQLLKNAQTENSGSVEQ